MSSADSKYAVSANRVVAVVVCLGIILIAHLRCNASQTGYGLPRDEPERLCSRTSVLSALLRPDEVHAVMRNKTTIVGDNSRIASFGYRLRRAASPFRLLAFGGSVTAGTGTQVAWPLLLFKYLNETFPHPGNVLLNLAIPAAGAELPGYCASVMIPRSTLPTLVVLEFHINPSSDHDLDLLLSSLLQTHNAAVMGVEVFSTRWPTTPPYTQRGPFLNSLKRWDIPTVSLLKALLPYIGHENGTCSAITGSQIFAADMHHLNTYGHEVLNSLLVSYLCENLHGNVSQGRPWLVKYKRPVTFCATQYLPEDVAPVSFPVTNSNGWSLQGTSKRGYFCNRSGGQLDMQILTTRAAWLSIGYLRSPQFSIGEAHVFVNRKRTTTLTGYWTRSFSIHVFQHNVTLLHAGTNDLRFVYVSNSSSGFTLYTVAWTLVE